MPSSFFNDMLQTLTERSRSLLGLPRGALAGGQLPALAHQLLSRRGEASGVALARSILDTYRAASVEARRAFLLDLAESFGPDPVRLAQAVEAWRQDPDVATVAALSEAAESRRQELIRRLNLAPGGTAALVRMREDLLEMLPEEPRLKVVDADFRHLFSSWFNRGFLVLRPIDWTTPANILEKIIRYEAVHEIRDWNDLRNRLEPTDRRCFAFFHPQLVDEPLIFVEVALTATSPAAIAPLLAAERTPLPAKDATTAVFYSISNTQKGLAGVSFGHFLIKQVAEDLQRELPNLKTFVTLSPVPGFASWLRRERDNPTTLDAETLAGLAALDEPGWHEDPARAEDARRAVLPAAAAYFLRAKGRNGRPLDPVARFHLGNGARLDRLNPLGDVSPKGLRQSHGLMVNYCYDLDDIEANHEAYAEKGVVASARSVQRALPPAVPAREAPAEAP
ncbi:malonyl-CoA decarboxylase [Alsobacter sp. SYSU M60028]|uniref:Malonyl-CoA decarboxylase n=1 Tax=Alsobacter ponti TaxID=2962936 RepID=A0ABT1LC47_9HYPH|nr:malonyl-CoA decarboxylase [Alsobacter ponti]MCP8939076.1 malonyl-CoA decarboxylase [Alsobacter ponti]